jgi:salicylate hydroxylase
VDLLREKYKDWNPTVRALTQLTPYTNLYPNFAGEALPTWVFGSRVTLIGDAAHAHGGAFAAGGSLALDDALALGLAMKHAFGSSSKTTSFSVERVGIALELYSKTRQPHTARLLRIIHNQITQKPQETMTAEEEDAILLKRMRNRPDTVWLSEHDVEAAFAATVEQLEDGNVAKQSPSMGRINSGKTTGGDIERYNGCKI